MLYSTRVQAELAALWHPVSGGQRDELSAVTLDSDLYIGVRLVLRSDGSLQVLRVDMQSDSQPPTEAESWTDVPPHAVAALAFHLLREKYAGSFDAVRELQSYCERHAIPYQSTQV